MFALAGGLIVLALLAGRIGRANRQALTPRDERADRRSPTARLQRPRERPPPADRRPGVEDQPLGITSGIYVLEIRHRRAERGDVDYLKIGRSSDVAEQIRAHRTLEGDNVEVYGIAWTTGHAEVEAQIHRVCVRGGSKPPA